MEPSPLIYLDNNATTALDPRVLQAMLAHLSMRPENPSSIHSLGRKAKAELQSARETIAAFFSVEPKEIIFTSGATEAINLALRGLFPLPCHDHIITSNAEHSAVFKTIEYLEKRGCKVSYLPVSSWGAVRTEQVEAAIQSETKAIVLTAVNSETGVKTDINSIAELAKKRNIAFLVDGVALLGKESFSISEGISAIAFSGHKLHAPKGIGLLLARPTLKLTPLMTGGDQEFGKRPGTENLASIVGLAKAISLLHSELPAASLRMKQLRERFEHSLKQHLDVEINGLGPRTVNTSNLCFLAIDGEALLMNLDLRNIACSHGSACASGTLEPSRILLQMGLHPSQARSSLRFSLSRFTTESEIDLAIERIIDCVQKLK